MTDNPHTLFTQWLERACAHADITEPTAMTLATASASGVPSARIVLLKAHDERGFVFYTNLSSRKSEELRENQHAALCFYWMPLELQIRIVGRVEAVSAQEADAYFSTRVREKQIGAWASKQSQPMEDAQALERRLQECSNAFEGKEIERPEFWSGWRVVAQEMEFWQQGDFRLHHREHFQRQGATWHKQQLYP